MNSREEKLDKFLEEQRKIEKEAKKKRHKETIKKLCIFFTFLIVFLVIYISLIEPNLLVINEYKITNTKISTSFYGYKILEFGDIHYGTTINENNFKKIVDKINQTKPNIVIFTGDLIDKNYTPTENDIKIITSFLKEIKATHGKYAVVGEDDVENTYYENIIYDGNFILLKNKLDQIYAPDNNSIVIYGVDDYLKSSPNIDELKKEEYSSLYKIVICHEPDYFNEIKDSNIDLFLAGHSHNGQINIPYLKNLYLPEKAKTYYENHYKVNNTDLFMTNGIGTTNLSLRFMSIPNINLFRIVK